MFGFLQNVTDPICKMKVDKNKTKYSSEYKGDKFYFCSESCKSQFDAKPEDFVKDNTTNKSCC
ncbi:MAG: YHS domain-containing protein [Patescibacteria group bacterium]|nr:YHS domain-containing protein [Patescibacteria group bacterium]